uniref:Uncharacterized protein n=1 Tax=Phlebotomus papatasi TaxID=29031 RepID=A0A1B0EW30_PHLPP
MAFIVQEVVENQATKLQKMLQNRLISQSEAMRLAEESLSLSPEGFVLAIHALLCQQKVATHCAPIGESEEVVLKFAVPGEKIQAISKIEYSIYRLEMMEQELMKKIDAQEESAKREEEKAREYIKKSNRNLAKFCLSRRNVFLKNLEKHTKAIMNIQEMLSKIHDVTLNKKILQTYKLGGKSLQDALKNSGITAEMVDQTVDEMREAIQVSDEVEAALGTDLSSPADNAELEQELANLLEEDAAQKIQDDDILRKLEALRIPEGSPSAHTPRQTETSQY